MTDGTPMPRKGYVRVRTREANRRVHRDAGGRIQGAVAMKSGALILGIVVSILLLATADGLYVAAGNQSAQHYRASIMNLYLATPSDAGKGRLGADVEKLREDSEVPAADRQRAGQHAGPCRSPAREAGADRRAVPRGDIERDRDPRGSAQRRLRARNRPAGRPGGELRARRPGRDRGAMRCQGCIELHPDTRDKSIYTHKRHIRLSVSFP